jgi:hypothetical protein
MWKPEHLDARNSILYSLHSLSPSPSLVPIFSILYLPPFFLSGNRIANLASLATKPRRQSLEKPTPKKHKSTSSSSSASASSSSTPQALTSTSLPNTPFQSPQTTTFPTFPSTLRSAGPKPLRCHICHRAEGVSLRVSECGLCERGMCQVCTRVCVACDRERCSKCCVEEYPPPMMRIQWDAFAGWC